MEAHAFLPSDFVPWAFALSDLALSPFTTINHDYECNEMLSPLWNDGVVLGTSNTEIFYGTRIKCCV